MIIDNNDNNNNNNNDDDDDDDGDDGCTFSFFENVSQSKGCSIAMTYSIRKSKLNTSVRTDELLLLLPYVLLSLSLLLFFLVSLFL